MLTFEQWWEGVKRGGQLEWGRPEVERAARLAWDVCTLAKQPEGVERHAVLEEAAKVCIAMYAKEPASRRTDILLEVASRIRELKRREPQGGDGK